MRLRVEPNDEFLRDEQGRAWLLRGVNMSGSCKFPKYPQPVPSHIRGPAFLKPREPEASASPNTNRTTPTGGVVGDDAELNARDSVHDNDNENGDANANAKTDGNTAASVSASNPRENLEERHISFVGRPFELDEATDHLSRLRHWGFRMIRWVVTWEAIEHQGP